MLQMGWVHFDARRTMQFASEYSLRPSAVEATIEIQSVWVAVGDVWRKRSCIYV